MKHSPLAKAGSSGLSSATHLHFEIRFVANGQNFFDASSIDPVKLWLALKSS
ncbi:MAG: M23 family metallopeptidase [Candidatus Caenarcaniphilales bacterium]|nr:M23 family metallopeptidase [Candidatus Caenarcaniphilales bacterium]